MTPRRHPLAVVSSVLGEILLTAGVIVLLFIIWRVWIDDAAHRALQVEQAAEITEEWRGRTAPTLPASDLTPVEPVVMMEPANAVVFGTLIVPRFGEGWTRPIAQGVGLEDVLNPIGLGHYPGTRMPGAIGNFAIAGHRTTWGSPFYDIDKLQPGDDLWVETADGWYRYRFAASEIVAPESVEVLNDAPRYPGGALGDRFITLTTCHPLWSAAERWIAYGVLDRFYPRAGGLPTRLGGEK